MAGAYCIGHTDLFKNLHSFHQIFEGYDKKIFKVSKNTSDTELFSLCWT